MSKDETKYKLADAMKECLKNASVEKITVKQICDAGRVTRQTFYRHFLDKYDLINWYFDKMVLRSFGEMEQGHTVEESLRQKMIFIVRERVFFSAAFRCDCQNSLKDHDFELILQFYRDLIAKKTSEPLGGELGFLLEMYCQGSVYMTAKWVLAGFDMPPEKMAGILVEAMPPRVAAVFDELGLL